LGDEFQVFLSSAHRFPMMWESIIDFQDRNLRVGMGFGVLDTPFRKKQINVDGTAYKCGTRGNTDRP